ncbi:hypothetical protein BGZ52_008559 [Haplosporangium bisporale]|nr:hypothetical protein BGZ52_008559 [Haplosporangium bisporale]
MLKSATSFLALSLIALQVVVAQTIQKGIYLIQDTDSGKFLGIGPTPHIYPPIDTPVRLFNERDPFVQHWRVEEAKDGAVIISAAGSSPQGYNIVSKGDYVFVSAQKEPELWAVESSGQGEVQVKLPFNDKVFTSYPGSSPFDSKILLEPAQGSRNQRYRFVRLDRELYHGNRFYNQESC